MSLFIKTTGIVIKKRDFRENDSFFVIYTKDFGKIEVMARGVRKPQSKLAGNLTQFGISDLFIIKGKHYYQLAGSCIINNYSNLKTNFFSLFLLSHLLQTIDFLTELEQREQRFFYHLRQVLDFLSKHNLENKITEKNFLNYLGMCSGFSYQILCSIGFRPELNFCSVCKKNVFDSYYFDLSAGLICPHCKQIINKKINLETIKLLKFIQANNLDNFLKIKMQKQHLIEFIDIIFEYLQAQIGKQFKSKNWLQFFKIN